MRAQTFIFAAALFACAPRPALAQKIDVGGGVSATKVVYDGEGYSSIGPMVMIRFTDKHAIQILTDINSQRSPHAQNVRAVYFVQYRHTFGKPANRMRWHVTAGSAGGVERHHTPAFTYTENGHYDQGKWVPTAPIQKDVPAYTRWHAAPPIVPAFGVGIEVKITRQVAVQADFSMGVGPYFVAVGRAATGVIVHFGG